MTMSIAREMLTQTLEEVETWMELWRDEASVTDLTYASVICQQLGRLHAKAIRIRDGLVPSEIPGQRSFLNESENFSDDAK